MCFNSTCHLMKAMSLFARCYLAIKISQSCQKGVKRTLTTVQEQLMIVNITSVPNHFVRFTQKQLRLLSVAMGKMVFIEDYCSFLIQGKSMSN